MRVRLLGTGSADGWPNAFCRCASCLEALRRGAVRGPTSALVDGRILLDCGPETPRAALRFADGLSAVTHILLTHDHPDHSAPMALLSRTWATRHDLLTVVGPAQVTTAWRAWCAPDDPVRFITVTPGDRLDADGYDVRVLPARHRTWDHDASAGPAPTASGEQCVLYDLTGPDGVRLLYATDTGPLPAAALDAVEGARFEIALIEATYGDRQGPGRPSREDHRDHLDLPDLAEQLTLLRGRHALGPRSQVVAVHLSHHSPPDLRSRLSDLGVLLLDDGAQLTTSHLPPEATMPSMPSMPARPAPSATARFGTTTAGTTSLSGPDGVTPARPGARALPRRTLILGGARSGKSVTAERLLAGAAEVTYVATGAMPSGDDPEWAERITAHRERRPAHWTTVETTDLAATLTGARTALLVDCIGTWLTSALDRVGAWDRAAGWRERLDDELDAVVDAWHDVPVPVVAVSNEVGSGVVPATASGRLFRDELGRLNARLSRASERVLLVVAGRALALPPGDREATWTAPAEPTSPDHLAQDDTREGHR